MLNLHTYISACGDDLDHTVLFIKAQAIHTQKDFNLTAQICKGSESSKSAYATSIISMNNRKKKKNLVGQQSG